MTALFFNHSVFGPSTELLERLVLLLPRTNALLVNIFVFHKSSVFFQCKRKERKVLTTLFFVSYILNDNIKSFLVKLKAIKQSASKVRDFYEYNQRRDEVSIHKHKYKL